MDAKREKLIRQLIGEAQEAGEDYHGDKYWDLLHDRQQILLKMMVVVLDEMLPKNAVVKEKKAG